MANFTAHILIGNPHPRHGGYEPTHCLLVSENKNPMFYLYPLDIHGLAEGKILSTIWVPTEENTLEDALLMIAIHVSKNEEILKTGSKYCPKIDSGVLELYEDIIGRGLDELYKVCRKIKDFPWLKISVFSNSCIIKQLDVLKKYQINIELCCSVYSYKKGWQKEFGHSLDF